MIKVILFSSSNIGDLEVQVNKWMKDNVGWEPFGLSPVTGGYNFFFKMQLALIGKV